MKRITLAAICAVAGAATTVSARQYYEYREYAAPTVIDVSTQQYGRSAYRAITGYERGRPYLVVEEIGWVRQGRDRRPVRQEPMANDEMREGAQLAERYDDLRGRRGALAVRKQRPITYVAVHGQSLGVESLRSLALEGWNGDRLTFSASDDRGAYRCTVSIADQGPPACDGGWAPPNPGPAPTPTPPPPPSPDLELLKAATAACNAAFMGTTDRDQCLQIMISAARDMRPALTACRQAFMGSTDQLTCLRKATQYYGDAAAALQQCSRTFMGSTSTMTCFDILSRENLPFNVIPACASAFMGSTEQLRCMRTVAGTQRDPAGLIQYCRENNMGSSAIMACIEKYR